MTVRTRSPVEVKKSHLFHHPVVGDLELSFESFATAADSGQSLLTYTAEPGSPSQDALNLLASWVATTQHCG